MEIKSLKNPICDRCKIYEKFNTACYIWGCLECKTLYEARKYRQGDEEWFEYEPINQPELPDLPMGVSQWLEYGKKYGYYHYFKREILNEKKV